MNYRVSLRARLVQMAQCRQQADYNYAGHFVFDIDLFSLGRTNLYSAIPLFGAVPSRPFSLLSFLRRASLGRTGIVLLLLGLMAVFGWLTVLPYQIDRMTSQDSEEIMPLFNEPQFLHPRSIEEPVEPGQDSDIAVVVLAAKRPEVHQLVHQLVAQKPQRGFRILVSLDGAEKQTTAILQQIESSEVRLLRLTNDKSRSFTGSSSSDSYAKISRHYLRVLDHVLMKLNFSHAVLLEDDLLIAPDFYQYFRSLRRALDTDESIFCVSAWNDNGQISLVTKDPQLLHRTDFFPGLGWMINQRHWLRVRKVWPKTQYDDFLRLYMLKNGLVCVRPELSRTFNIGRSGGRNCQLSSRYTYSSKFYHNYLSRMALNRFNVTLTKSAVDKVIGRSADQELDKFARSLPAMNVSQLLSSSRLPSAVRLRYATAGEFIALALGIGAIPEVWFGAPRASILGISTVSVRGSRVYIVPDRRLPINKKIFIPTMPLLSTSKSRSFLFL
ncbi:hypothetical protein BOX15_Mlig027550g1 [Macrostomum lignano]|uniref:Alpha-1,3-mannosyl-glycoprotein 2-beta-N-acetylglucosaminyltransferase n=1 Tax=Macrostomum lignano TaxID=282301 RepID=A0A267FHI0_9PLAT|nr:hypothetical protein BOX15_Mlig027550g1 [Macrostomum lignano]